MIVKKYKVADFFSGCGGLSHGFGLTGRFHSVLGSDIKPEALETFVANHPDGDDRPEVILDDIRKVSPSSVQDRLTRFGIMKSGQLDCLIGGPPCEGFSQNRSINSGGHSDTTSATRTHRFMEDPRNQLFRWFVELANHLQPRVILIENVPDLVRHKDGQTLNDILSALDRAGYMATVRVLNAADYGVPQMRRRAIFLGQRKEDFIRTGARIAFPEPTHVPFPLQNTELEDDANWMPGDSGYWPTVWEAIGDLPLPAPKAQGGAIAPDYLHEANSNLRKFLRGRSGLIHNHVARPLGKNGLEKVRSIAKGQRAAAIPDEIRPRASYHYSYSRLLWSEPARTITKFCYHVGSGMFAHPLYDRALTMREAARLQTFPDDFRFMSDNIRELSAMIGSAVPPLLGKQLGTSVCRYLDLIQLAKLSKAERKLVKPQLTDAVMKRLETQEWRTDNEPFEQISLFGKVS